MAGNAAPTGRPIVWIEDDGSHIARGQADSLTREGLHVNLAEPPAFQQGDQVAVRLAFERGAPSFATTARVTSVRSDAGLSECSLMWVVSATERKALEAWLMGTGSGRTA